MTIDEIQPQGLTERLKLIEDMMMEGRRGTEKWAWSFLLWGVAYYVAIAWSNWGRASLAWPVTMISAAVVTGIVAARLKHSHPATTIGRAMRALWTVTGTALFVLLMGLSVSGRYETHTFVAIVGAMLAVANGASGMILRWKMQMACALVWLGTGLAACFVSESEAGMLFLAAIFFCQIVFGFYGMVRESRRRGQRGAVHA
jgi:hypothetical protein